MVSPILHISDSHLRPSHLGSLSRGPDFTRALRWCIKYAIDNKLSAVCHSGDLLNDNHPNSQTMADLFSIHQLAREGKMPIYTVTGNHDMAKPSWVEVIQDTFGDSEYGFICADNKRFTIPGTTTTVFGLPFLSREELVKAMDAAEPADILIWHGMVKEFVDFPVEGCVSIDDFIVGKWRAVLLGDVHVAGYTHHHNVLIGYPGSTELCARNEALQKYAFSIAISETEVSEPRMVPIPTRPVRCFRINMEEDLARIISELAKEKFDRPPLIFIAYNAAVPGVIARIKNAVTADAIVRYEALQEGTLDLAASSATPMVAAGVELQELVGSFLSDGPLKDLATQLVSAEVNPKELIQNFVGMRLKEMEGAAK